MTGPTSKPTQTHSLSRRGWTATAVLVLLAALLTQAGPFSRDIFDEGRRVTGVAVTLAETVREEFAADFDSTGFISLDGPFPCASAPPWGPNRIVFTGLLEASLPADTDIVAVSRRVEETAQELGYVVKRASSGRRVRFESTRKTIVDVTLYEGSVDRDAKIVIRFASRCLPRPRGYRGGSFENRRALIDDWPARIGFQSGPLAEARIR